MRILLTGANGYIGTHLLSLLGEEGAELVALVRSKHRIRIPDQLKGRLTLIEADLLDRKALKQIPQEIDVAYYLVHSLIAPRGNFADLEMRCAKHFAERLDQTKAKQIIYLSGLSKDSKLSSHLASRQRVEAILGEARASLTTLRASIIIGSGSASFEIIRDLVEKLPAMVAPRWVNNLCQPIAIDDVLYYLRAVRFNPSCMNRTFDIGGPEKLTYKQMMQILAKERGLKRYILTVPVLTPRLSSYWLVFITSTSFTLASNLVDSLKNESICSENSLKEILPHKCLTYREAVERAFAKIEQNSVLSSWRDAMAASRLHPHLCDYIQVPRHGCMSESIERCFRIDPSAVQKRIWSLGGQNGWYGCNWAWRLRGALDKLIGGVGLRRGRTHPDQLKEGDALDFWRVLLADEKSGHLLLYAEMRLPGEAWLEFRIHNHALIQTATFRPRGVLGRIYWYALYPIHKLIFHRLAYGLTK